MSREHVRVAVIGAGFAGIGAAIRLARSGERSFVVLERAGSVGGTWRDNVYPGVACDIPSHLYSLSFAPKPDWRRRFAEGSEIRTYLERCAEEPGVRERIRTGVALLDATWSEGEALWQLQTSNGPITASFLVLATGRFTDPHVPEVPGLDGFAGPICHTARWDAAVAGPGMRVGVVGTGASAAQLVPRLLDAGAQVTVFQRTAPWVIPKDDALYSEAERARFVADDTVREQHRKQIFDDMEAWFVTRQLGTDANAELGQRSLAHLHAQVQDPDLRELVTPGYTMGCKRIVVSDDWYPALSSPALTLEASALAHITDGIAVAASGNAYQLDSLVFATGFEASRPVIGALVHGRDGESLSEHWRDGMVSYASTAVSGFPNCFMLGGPNAALGHNSAVAVLETQITHLLDALDQLAAVGVGTVCEVRAEAERRYTVMLETRAAETVWAAGDCTSWYRDGGTGRITLLYPGTANEYASDTVASTLRNTASTHCTPRLVCTRRPLHENRATRRRSRRRQIREGPPCRTGSEPPWF